MGGGVIGNCGGAIARSGCKPTDPPEADLGSSLIDISPLSPESCTCKASIRGVVISSRCFGEVLSGEGCICPEVSGGESGAFGKTPSFSFAHLAVIPGILVTSWSRVSWRSSDVTYIDERSSFMWSTDNYVPALLGRGRREYVHNIDEVVAKIWDDLYY
jgi:hypothetical protein